MLLGATSSGSCCLAGGFRMVTTLFIARGRSIRLRGRRRSCRPAISRPTRGVSSRTRSLWTWSFPMHGGCTLRAWGLNHLSSETKRGSVPIQMTEQDMHGRKLNTKIKCVTSEPRLLVECAIWSKNLVRHNRTFFDATRSARRAQIGPRTRRSGFLVSSLQMAPRRM